MYHILNQAALAAKTYPEDRLNLLCAKSVEAILYVPREDAARILREIADEIERWENPL